MDEQGRDPLIDIVAEALRMSEPERDVYLRDACVDDAMREEARSLLRAVARESGFLDHATAHGVRIADEFGSEVAGVRVGPYTLRQKVGEGGFGAVFMAEQREPVRRMVALKIIKPGMDSRAVVARFEQERQALALMDHPSIARVLDAGATESGRPYFVMELVRGESIVEYCDRHGLSTEARLELFVQVCRAVQHAHTKGVIHRDIKPGNVLVTEVDGRPVPKVIDFGIAKATGGRLTEKTVYTEFRQLIGTPTYMSPEQADNAGVDVDTRTDVYSLGVVLYELLTGTTPFDTKRLLSVSWGEMQRIIREDDPPRPSTRLSSMRGEEAKSPAGRREIDPSRLAAAVRGDLDWIVMRCLEKDRSRRYQTAEEVAADVTRHIRGEAVLAAPPSAAYRVKKFARRHRATVIAACAVGAAMVIGLAAALWQAYEARLQRDAARVFAAEAVQARNQADESRKQTEEVANFQASQLKDIDVAAMGTRMRSDVIQGARAAMERAKLEPREIEVRQAQLADLLADTNFTDVALQSLDWTVFSRALEVAKRQFKDQPLVRADLLLTIGQAMSELGLQEAAGAPLSEALEIRRRELGDDDPETIAGMIALGSHVLARGNWEQAEALIAEALERGKRVQGEEHPQTLRSQINLGSLRSAQGRNGEAEQIFRDGLAKQRRVLGPEDPATIDCIYRIGASFANRARHAESEPFFREALGLARRVLGEDHVATLSHVHNVATSLLAQGKTAEAEPLLRDLLERLRRIRGDQHPQTLTARSTLGALLVEERRYEEAEVLLREALDGRNRVFGDDHPLTLQSKSDLGVVLIRLQRFAEAEPLMRSVLVGRQRRLGLNDPMTLTTQVRLAVALTGIGHFSEAETLLKDTQRAAGAAHGEVCAEEMESLYTQWDRAEPGKGYDRKAKAIRDGISPGESER